MNRVIVPYVHDPYDSALIYLGVTVELLPPADNDWVPAFRDTIHGTRVLWAFFTWVKDRDGVRKMQGTLTS